MSEIVNSGIIAKVKVTYSHTCEAGHAQVHLREFSTAQACNGAVMLPSFPGAAITSVLVGGFLRDALNLPLVGVVTSPIDNMNFNQSPQFPPRCVVEKGRPVHPVRIFGNKHLVIITSEFKLPTAELMNAVAECINHFQERHSIRLILCVDGVPMEGKLSDEDTKKVMFMSTNTTFTSLMTDLKHDPLDESLVSGLPGILMAEGAMRSVDVALLVAPTAAELPDARSAVTIVKAIDAYLTDVEIDTKPLAEKAQKLAESVAKLIDEDKTSKTFDSSANTMYA